MYITCFNCKNTWEVPSGTLLGARLKYRLGYKEYSFPCPSCGAKNIFSDEEFHSNDHPQVVVPVTATQFQPGVSDERKPSKTRLSATPAPTNPIEDPAPVTQKRQAAVRVRGVEAHMDHSYWA